MTQNIDQSSTGNDYNNCLIQNYPRFLVFYLWTEIRDQSQEIFYQISRFVAVGGWQVCVL